MADEAAVSIDGQVVRDTDHRYWVQGKRRELPGVTHVLSAAGLVDYKGISAEVLERAAARGWALHAAAHYFDENDLDLTSVDSEIRGYLNGWIRFREETGFIPYAREQVVYSEIHQFAGTLDRVGHLQGNPVLLDIKTVAMLQRSTGPQTAAYAQAVRETGAFEPAVRYAVQLRRDGSYVVETYRDPNDWRIFQAALSLYHWKRRPRG